MDRRAPTWSEREHTTLGHRGTSPLCITCRVEAVHSINCGLAHRSKQHIALGTRVTSRPGIMSPRHAPAQERQEFRDLNVSATLPAHRTCLAAIRNGSVVMAYPVLAKDTSIVGEDTDCGESDLQEAV